MKKDIILAGVGGQGILTIATVLGAAALNRGWNLKQAEVHGMSQRGGDVQSHLRLSDQIIWSDLIPYGKADMILAVEPMEALRYLPYLAPKAGLFLIKLPSRIFLIILMKKSFMLKSEKYPIMCSLTQILLLNL